MKAAGIVLGILALGCLALRWLSPDREIVTRTTIDAPVALVWSILIDGNAYSAWNPFITRLDGRITPGASITITLRSGQNDPLRLSPQVVRVHACRELRWLGRLAVPGVFDGEHYFLLSPGADGDTLLVHGERFSGILPWIVGVERYRADFAAMNHALAQRAEISALNHQGSIR